MYKFSYETIIGKIYIAEENNKITNISYINILAEEKQTQLIKKTYDELCQYLKGERTNFDIPISPKGSQFQQKVWQTVSSIPYGETRSYKDIANLIGAPKSSRAVGMANKKNPIVIIIPCHRVIGTNNSLIGYNGGTSLKKKLLEIEKVNLKI